MTAGNRDGRWTTEEHEAFLRGMAMYGRRWTKVADVVGTRTTVQVRSHAQKWEIKMAKEQKAKAVDHTSTQPNTDVGLQPLSFGGGYPSSLTTSASLLLPPNNKAPNTGKSFDSAAAEDKALPFDPSLLQNPQDLLHLGITPAQFEELKKKVSMQSGVNLFPSLPLHGLPGSVDSMALLRDSFGIPDPSLAGSKKHKRRDSNSVNHQQQQQSSMHPPAMPSIAANQSTQRQKMQSFVKQEPPLYADATASDVEFEKLAKDIVSSHETDFSSTLWDQIWDEDGAEESGIESWPTTSESSSQFTSSSAATTFEGLLQPHPFGLPVELEPIEPPMVSMVDYQLAPYDGAADECDLMDIGAFGESDDFFMSDDES